MGSLRKPMTYIINGKIYIIDDKEYYIYLHSDQIIVHLKNRNQTDILIHYQIEINNNIVDWDNGFAQARAGKRIECVLPIEIKKMLEKYVSNSAFW